MNKKEVIIPVVVVALSLLFAFVSMMVFLSRGKSRKWIARKMKIGALLLTINAFTPGFAQEIEVMCYDISEENVMALQNNKIKLVIDNKKSEKLIKACVDYRTGEDYSFCVIDNRGHKVQTGLIEAADGKFNKWKEDFEIKLDTRLKPGRYYLLFFDVKPEAQDTKNAKNRIQIEIKNE